MKDSQRRVLAIALAVRRDHVSRDEGTAALDALASMFLSAQGTYSGGHAATLRPGAAPEAGSDLLPILSKRLTPGQRLAFDDEFHELESDPPRAYMLVERIGLDLETWKTVWHREDTKQPSTLPPPTTKPGPSKVTPLQPSANAPVGRKSAPPPITFRTERPTRVMAGAASRYEVQRELARGGMGRVLIAVDKQLGREVAIKEMLVPVTREALASGGSSMGGEMERFLREAKVTGQLEHPYIVPVYEIGEREDGTVFYSMKLVRGETMADRIRDVQRNRDLSAGEKLAARLKMLDAFVDACHAVAYAHSRGVVNRDLKPANIMIGDFGETLVLDWGLARVKGQEDRARKDLINATAMMSRSPASPQSRPDSTKLTLDGSVIGTPSYMPPEQARGELDEIDERSDVYSLGAILYELATGLAPFEGPSAELVLRSVLHTDPIAPRVAEPHVPKELEAIIVQAIAKEKGRRISSAKFLADEVSAFRDGRTISLYQYNLWEQLSRFVKRHRGVSLLAVSLVLVMVASTLVSVTWANLARKESAAAREAETQAREAETTAKKAKDQAVAAAKVAEGLRLAALSKQTMTEAPSLSLLLAIEGAERAPGSAANNSLYAALFALNERRRFITHNFQVNTVAFSPDSKILATGCDDFLVRLFDISTGEEIRKFDGCRAPVRQLAWSDDGRRLAIMSLDFRGLVMDMDRGSELSELKGHTEAVRGMAMRPGGAHVVTWSNDNTARLTQCGTGDALVLQHEGNVNFASFSPDGTLLATCGQAGVARVWDVATGVERADLKGHAGDVMVIRWSPDGRRLVTVGSDRSARTWDAAGALLKTLSIPSTKPESAEEKLEVLYDAGWKRDSSRLGVMRANGTAAVWDGEGNERQGELKACAGFDPWTMLPDWSLMTRGGGGYTVDVIRPESGAIVSHLPGHEYEVFSRVLSPNGRLIATGAKDRWAIVWSTFTDCALQRTDFFNDHNCIATSADYSTALCPRGSDALDLFDTATGSLLGSPDVPRANLVALQLSPDGTELITAEKGSDDVNLRDSRTGKVKRVFPGSKVPLVSAAFTLTGEAVWALYQGEHLRTWKTSTGEQIGDLKIGPESRFKWLVSPDGRWMAATSGTPQDVILWNLVEGRLVRHLKGHTGMSLGIAWHADSKTFFTTAMDASIRKWTTDSEKPVGYYRFATMQEYSVHASPDGRYLVIPWGGKHRLVDSATMTDYAYLEPPGGISGFGFVSGSNRIFIRVADNPSGFLSLDALAAARAVAPRELTPAERQRFDVGTQPERDAFNKEWSQRYPMALVNYKRAEAAMRDGDYDKAIQLLEEGEKLLPKHFLLHYQKAIVLAMRLAGRPIDDPRREEDMKAALAALEETMECGIPAEDLNETQELKVVRDDPRYAEMVKRHAPR